MTDFLEEKRKEISKRLEELRPLVDEFHRLEEAERALSGVGGTATAAKPAASAAATATATTTTRRRPGRPKGSTKKTTAAAATKTTATKSTAKKSAAKKSTGRRGRPPGSGSRSGEALALVKANPGITIPQLAEKMGIKQNYLYRVIPTLSSDGKIKKSGKGWKPA